MPKPIPPRLKHADVYFDGAVLDLLSCNSKKESRDAFKLYTFSGLYI